MFGLRNQTILDEVVNHEFIPQIWWNDSIPVLIISLACEKWGDGAPTHSIPQPNKKVKSEKMMD